MTSPAPESAPLAAALTETPLGWAGVAVTGTGIRHATLFHRTPGAAAGELRAFGGDLSLPSPLAAEACERLRTYAAGARDALEGFPVDLPPGLPPASRAVLLALRRVPPGETRSYSWLAEAAGLGRANARAAGAIIGANPIPLWLPCHRIVAADGSLHGYGGGLAMKRQLLQLEGALPTTFPWPS
jgi:methylated-DNA-[protein]-cysteine S-methyltransferase